VPDVGSYLAWDLSLYRVFGLADSPRLHLVACTGVFSTRQHDYNRRLVIYAEGSD